MKCLIYICFLAYSLSACCEGGALCPPGALDPICAEEKESADKQELLSRESTEAQCLAGSEWESNCHRCRCSESGIAECLKQDVCDKGVFEEPALCKPNTTFHRDCNTCICLDNGLGLCSLEVCNKPYSPVDIVELSEESETEKETTNNSDESDVIVPENTIQDNRNSLGVEHEVVKRSTTICEPREEFMKDCNPCKCAANGLSYTCTKNECLDADMNKEVEVFMKSEGADHIERNSVCRARNTFYIGCNACHCNPLGTDYTCTNKRCPLPADVEVFRDVKDIESTVPFSTDDDLEMLKA